MFCENCGSAVAENERFCGNCGAPVAPPFQQQGFAPQFNQTAPAPKSKKKAGVVIIACVAVVLVAAIVVGAIMMFAPKSMAALEKESFRKMISSFVSFTNIDSMMKDSAYSIEVEPGDYLIDMIGGSSVDLSWLDTVGLDVATNISDKEYGYEAKLSLNGKEIATIDAVFDVDKKIMKLMLDGLSDSVCVYDMSESVSSVSIGVLASRVDVNKAVKVLEKYYDMALEYLKDATDSKGTFDAGGVVQSCKIYTADLSEKQLKELAQKILESALNDSDIKDIVDSLYDAGMLDQYNNYSGSSEFYEDFQENIREALDNLKDEMSDASDDTAFTLVDYVSGNEIIGRKIITYSDGSKDNEIVFGNAHDGNKFGTVVSVNGTDYLVGSGTQNGTKINGEMHVYSDGSDEIVTIGFVDYDYSKDAGEIDLSLSKEGWYLLTHNSSTSRDLSLSTLKITMGGNTETLDFVIGNESLFKATISKGNSRKIKIDNKLPQVDYNDWADTLDTSELLERLEDAGVPDSLTRQIRSSLK